ncbi:head decoration protein [Paraburkholderia atlantica]|uniref:head decoration protein n=1 Tax=Paraburkholderia atlantica TaxID=2654982 RepID=UPI00161838AA|nr:head decoration protein [Paraburkholderia atlantica]MBB5414101.1 hypothetical protein [Paraburkholderia atlantica]
MGNPTYTPLVESWHNGGFLVSQAPGHQSFEQGTLTGGAKVLAGTVLGTVTATGKYKTYDPSNTDGSQTPSGILFATKDATSADKPCTVVKRLAEVNASELIWAADVTGTALTTALAGLVAITIIPR